MWPNPRFYRPRAPARRSETGKRATCVIGAPDGHPNDDGYETADRIWLDLRERRSIETYRTRAEHERIKGRAQVGIMLDGLCRAIGADPVTWWRIGADPVTWWRIPYAEEQGR